MMTGRFLSEEIISDFKEHLILERLITMEEVVRLT